VPNYAIKRDLRENTGFKSNIGRVGPLFWLLGLGSKNMDTATTIEKLVSLLIAMNETDGTLVGVDGFDGTGKTTLAFKLANELSGIRVGLDCYVEKEREAERYVGLLRLEDLARDISRLLRCFPYVVVDGVCLSEALSAIGITPKKIVYVKKTSLLGLWHKGFDLQNYLAGSTADSWLENSILSYHQHYQPHVTAAVCYSWTEA